MGDRRDRPLYRKEVAFLCAVITISVSSIVGAMIWVDQRIDLHSEAPHSGAVTHREFQIYSRQVLQRLESIEEAIRGTR